MIPFVTLIVSLEPAGGAAGEGRNLEFQEVYWEKSWNICGKEHDQTERLMQQCSVCKQSCVDRRNNEFSAVEEALHRRLNLTGHTPPEVLHVIIHSIKLNDVIMQPALTVQHLWCAQGHHNCNTPRKWKWSPAWSYNYATWGFFGFGDSQLSSGYNTGYCLTTLWNQLLFVPLLHSSWIILNSNTIYQNIPFLSFFLSFLVGPPNNCKCRELLLRLKTLSETHPLGWTSLEERSTHRRDLYLKTYNIHKTEMPTPGDIQTGIPCKREASGPRFFRPRDHWNRTYQNIRYHTSQNEGRGLMVITGVAGFSFRPTYRNLIEMLIFTS